MYIQCHCDYQALGPQVFEMAFQSTATSASVLWAAIQNNSKFKASTQVGVF